jgi:hypothetical protein
MESSGEKDIYFKKNRHPAKVVFTNLQNGKFLSLPKHVMSLQLQLPWLFIGYF